MLRRALIVIVALGPIALPAASLAYDIKPKTPETAFSKKTRPDILGVSADSSAPATRAIFESAFRGRGNADIQEQKFGGSALSYTAALVFTLPSDPKQTGEVLSSSFSSPASANLVYFVDRSLTFALDQQPSRAEMVKQVIDKYGAPTIVGNQHLYYFYRGGSIMSVGGGETLAGQGKKPGRHADRGKGRQLRRRAQRRADTGRHDGPGRQGAVHATGFQAHDQRGQDRRRCPGCGTERSQPVAESQRAEAIDRAGLGLRRRRDHR